MNDAAREALARLLASHWWHRHNSSVEHDEFVATAWDRFSPEGNEILAKLEEMGFVQMPEGCEYVVFHMDKSCSMEILPAPETGT